MMKHWDIRKQLTSRFRQFVTVPMGRYVPLHFLIIGAQKCGTTSLFDLMLQHPMIHRGTKAEVEFFSSQYRRGLNWYHGQFPSTFEIDKRHYVLEKSTGYIYKPQCAERIYTYNSHVKLVLLLRDPVDRAFSAWSVPDWDHFGFHSFEEAVDDQIERIRSGSPEFGGDRQPSYLYRGFYALQIKRYLNYFSRDQLLILEMKELRTNAAGVYRKTLDFFNLPPDEADLSSFRNRNENPNKAKMNPDTRQRLQAFFQPYNEELYDLLGYRYEWG